MSEEKNSRAAYLFDPKSPLVFRTGRPFDQAGDPLSLDFPLPSTLAGACRTAIGDAAGVDFAKDGDKMKAIPVHGPLAVLISEDGKAQPLFPKPADAVYMRKDKKEGGSEEGEIKTEILQLKPEDSETDTWSDLPKGLQPVYPEKELVGKPYRKGANWWTEKNFVAWLLGNGELKIAPEELGWSGPMRELRTHVQLSSATLAAETGQLFQTENLSFSQIRIDAKEHDGWCRQRYGLLARLPDDLLEGHSALFRRIGGECRIAHVRRLDKGWPEINDDLRTALGQSRFIRLILATPALFEYGWRPGWIKDDMTGYPPGFSKDDQYPVKLQLKAFVTPRWQPVSGWDLQGRCPEKKKEAGSGCARAVRRMVPAGAVYWFKVEKGHEHIRRLWLRPVSDSKQDQCDGYGLALPGIWQQKS